MGERPIFGYLKLLCLTTQVAKRSLILKKWSTKSTSSFFIRTHIRTEYGDLHPKLSCPNTAKYGTQKTPYFNTFLGSFKAFVIYPAGNYLLKFNNKNTRIRCGVCSKLTTKTPGQLERFGVFIVNFEHISQLVIKLQLLISSR